MSSSLQTGTTDIAALYHAQHRWLLSWLRRRLNCSQSAADLMQDTFLRLLAKDQPLEILSLIHI